MARNGSGVYSLPAGNPVVSGTTISSTTHNTTMSDVATALTQSLAKDGQTVPTADLPMGSFKHTGVANATARNQYATVDQVQDGDYLSVGSVGGTANAITGSLSPAITAYVARMKVVLIPTSSNTGATTLNLNGIGALDVFTIDGSACTGGELVADIPAVLVLDAGADDWIITNPVARNAGFSNCTTPYTTLSTDRDKVKQLIIGGANTLTIDATLAGGRFRYYNSTGSSTTVNVSSGTLSFYNGSVSTGARTLAVGGIIDILVIGGGLTYCSGVGIT